jgi:hypothetical protein
MSDSLVTAHRAAVLLERDRGTVARALQGVAADDKDYQGRPRWRLARVVRALEVRQGTASSSGNSPAADAIEALAAELHAGLDEIEAEDDIAKRRELAKAVGKLVGRLDAAMERGAATAKPHERAMLAIARDAAIGGAVGRLMQLCNWNLAA